MTDEDDDGVTVDGDDGESLIISMNTHKELLIDLKTDVHAWVVLNEEATQQVLSYLDKFRATSQEKRVS